MQAELLQLGDVGRWQFETEERLAAAVVDAPDIAPARTEIHEILWQEAAQCDLMFLTAEGCCLSIYEAWRSRLAIGDAAGHVRRYAAAGVHAEGPCGAIATQCQVQRLGLGRLKQERRFKDHVGDFDGLRLWRLFQCCSGQL